MLTCVICGMPAKGNWASQTATCGMNQTCQSPECRAALMLHPELGDPERIGSQKPKGKWKPRERTSVIALLAEHQVGLLQQDIDRLTAFGVELDRTAEWGSDDWGTMKDERGAARPDAQAQIWSWLGRKSALLKAVGRHEGEAAIKIKKSRQQQVKAIIKKAFEIKFPDLCDVFYAWRCPCQYDHRVEYKTIDDLPKFVGYHNPCPRCGASPLEVINDY